MLNATRFLCRAALLLLLVPFARPAAAQSPAPAAAATLADALNPDGTLRAGLTGSFDASGYRLSTGADGQPAFTPTGTGDNLWADGFGHPGINSNIYSLLVAPNGDVIVGGQFQDAGGNPNADYLARWDGTAWQSYGRGFGNGVYALLLMPNGDLVVGGTFQALNGQPNTRVLARWNGTAWSGFGTGIQSGTVDDLALNAAGEIVVGGSFQDAGGNPNADRVARWDGTAWQSYGVGLPGFGNAVADVLILPNGDVVVGGDFDDAGNNAAADNIARWDGTAWQAFAPGLNSAVLALTQLPGGDIVAGGAFTRAGGTAATDYLARWNGTAWLPVGPGVNNSVLSLAVTSTGDLIAGGNFLNAGGNPDADYLARWDGTAWQNYGPAFGYRIMAVAVAPNGSVVAGGQHISFTPTLARVRSWNGTAWQDLEDRRQHGADFTVWTVAVAANGDLLMGGDFERLEGDPTINYLARWNGTRWVAIGGSPSSTVYDIKVAPNGDIIIGGFFSSIGGVAGIRYVARWNGTAWQGLGNGPHSLTSAVAIAANGDIYAGGAFNGTSGNGFLSVWEGSAWRLVSNSLNGTIFGTTGLVRALAPAPGGGVYVGGAFGSAGVANTQFLARYSGTAWSSVGSFSSPNGNGIGVYSLANAPNGDLIVGGNFSGVGGNTAARYIARWDGTAWSSIGNPFNDYVRAVAVAANGDILAGGNFTAPNPLSTTNRIARYNPVTGWLGLGTGLDGAVTGVAVAPNGAVVAGGYFTGTADKTHAFSFFGVYQPGTPLATVASAKPAALSLYPNPTRGLATLALPAAAVARPVRVLDALGREVRRTVLPAGVREGHLDVSNLPAGVYFVGVGTAVGRLVVE